MAELTFESGVGEVTGANFLLQINLTRMLVDCGMIQGESLADESNAEQFAYDPASIEYLLITHAHLDHVGRIGKLVKEGFRGEIYSTPQTKELAELVMRDAVGIMSMRASEQMPLYDMSHVDQALSLWKTVDYHTEFTLGPAQIYFKDAGHILGSAMIQIVCEGRKILFTGDLGNSPSPLLRDTENLGDADYIVMESVYGDRNHESREDRIAILRNIVNDAVNRGGALIIPSFAIDRTQVLLLELNNMVEKGEIRSVPVFLDSPMASRATEIHRNNTGLFNDNIRNQIRSGDDIFSFPKLKFTVDSGESALIRNSPNPKIILAGSGMSVGGRIVGHEAYYLPDPKNTILLVGYQAAGSLGRQIAEGAKKVKIGREHIKVKARIETLYGFSAHKDSDHLVEFVENADKMPKKVFVAMGELGASSHLSRRLNVELGVNAIVPDIGKKYVI